MPALVILEQMDRLIGLILQVPATAAAARIVLCLPFWWSGLSKLHDFSGGTAEMAALGLKPAWLFNALTILVQLGGSLLVILNLWTWLGAGALGVFTALVTVMGHRFWTLDGSSACGSSIRSSSIWRSSPGSCSWPSSASSVLVALADARPLASPGTRACRT